jgi:TonB family protein
MRKPAVALSVAMHVIAGVLLFFITFPNSVKPILPAAIHLFAPAPLLPYKNEGGGGQRQPLPATRGHAPTAVTPKVWTPPMTVRNETPKLVLLAALSEAPEYNISAPQIGDPLGKLGLPSGGIGGPVGIGSGGPGGGIGPGNGSKLGSGPGSRTGGGPAVKVTRDPQLIYKEDPEYSEEARKARHEGTVILEIEVDTNGRPINIRVLHGLGLGLDELAMAAVARWKFRPALSGDRPVTAPAVVHVNFHLL